MVRVHKWGMSCHGILTVGDLFRRAQRKLMHQVFNATSAKNFHPHSLKAAHGLLRRFLTKPGDILGNLTQ
jgi:hypothetical protein